MSITNVLCFRKRPNLSLPIYMLVVSFGLMNIKPRHGPIEITPGTHTMPRDEALRFVQGGEINSQPIILDLGDVLCLFVIRGLCIEALPI